MFNNLTKLMKILTRESPMQKVLFHFSRSTGLLRTLISVKNLNQYKKLRKKEHFAKRLVVRKIF